MAKVRPIGSVCYDLQERSHAAIDLYAWLCAHERLDNIDGNIHRGNHATSGSDQRPIVRSVIAPDDRSYDQSWHPTTDRTINRGVQRSIPRSIVAA